MFLPRQLAVKRPNPTPQTTSRQPGEQTPADDNIPVKRQRVEPDNPGSINSHDATEIVKCLELLLSDYFSQNVSPGWLMKKTRTIDGHNDCTWCIYLTPRHTNAWFLDVHLSALLGHEIFSTIKPLPTQKKLVTALQCCPSQRLEVRDAPFVCICSTDKTRSLGESGRIPHPEPYPHSHDRNPGWKRLGFIHNLYCKLYGSVAVGYSGLIMSRSPMSVEYLPVLEE